MKQKLVCIVMGQNCERFIGMALESVKDADAIYYLDGGSTDNTLNIAQDFLHNHPEIKPSQIDIHPYDQEDLGMNGKQRNFYLKYLKKNYKNYWALCIDADEIVENLQMIKEFIQLAKAGIYSVRMRHLIGDLSHEDSKVEIHPVLNRLFKISCAQKYEEREHPVLIGKNIANEILMSTIWHLAYCPNMWEIKKRYDNHLKKSQMHTAGYLKEWYYQHLFGTYPKKQFNPVELPSILLNHFGVNKDELYFTNRRLEHKHWIDAVHWKEFFKCKSATEFGCGLGPRIYAMNKVGINANGLEISQYAVDNKLHKRIVQADVTNCFSINPVDLVIAYDLLEHLSYDKLGHAIDNLIKSTKKHILISVPVLGDPNLYRDPTHIIKETKEWWINEFTIKKLKLIKTPDHFLYPEQILIFEK